MKDCLTFIDGKWETVAVVRTSKKGWLQDKGKFLRKSILVNDLQWEFVVAR